MNRGDFDTMFNELSSPGFRFENRGDPLPGSFGTRTSGQFRGSYARLASVRSWFSSLYWVAPTTSIGRLEREGFGHDGEHYAWTRILVNQYREAGAASTCGIRRRRRRSRALAYAEELARQT